MRFAAAIVNKEVMGAVRVRVRLTNGSDEFLVRIAEASARLEQNPERYRVLYKGFRRVLVERFPYRIFYQLRGNDVIVFRVLHHARDYTTQL